MPKLTNLTVLKLALLSLAVLAAGCASLQKPEAGGTISSEGPPATRSYVWSSSMEAKRVALEKATGNTGIAVLRTKDNQLQLNVPSDFSFDTDSAQIKPGMRPVLEQLAADLKADALSRMLIHIIGYTDSVGSDAVNDVLSLARAVSVRKYLEGQGIAPERIEVEGRGERGPLVSNDKSYGRALNRRVEIFLREPAAKS